MKSRVLLPLAALALPLAGLASAQLAESFTPARHHPAIAYAAPAATDAVARLNARLQHGEATLAFEPVTGYLRSALEALSIAPESQMLVFSKTSFQAPLITPQNPRALFFNDHVAVGWVRGGEVVEVAAQDPRQGVIFYTLAQERRERPQFVRNDRCVQCHLSTATSDVPGMFAASMFVAPTGAPVDYGPVVIADHRVPLEQRWGGWYVTGRHGDARHLGNGTVNSDGQDLASAAPDANQNVATLDGRLDLTGYPVRTSDVVALMVLEHQMHLSNLLTRAGWESRIAAPDAPRTLADGAPPADADDAVIAATRVGAAGALDVKTRPLREVAVEIVDYMLFVDEAPLAGRIEGSSGFAARFPAAGPRDRRGRSLRDLDLTTRLLRYPCSYLIYSELFAALPPDVRDAIYQRLWTVLSGGDPDPVYARLTLADRQAIVEILRDTKPDLPAYFQAVSR